MRGESCLPLLPNPPGGLFCSLLRFLAGRDEYSQTGTAEYGKARAVACVSVSCICPAAGPAYFCARTSHCLPACLQ